MKCTNADCDRGVVPTPPLPHYDAAQRWESCPTCKGMGKILRNVRFWQWVNGDYVKLTLSPRQELRHSDGGPTDEGYHSEHEVWRYELPERINLERHSYSKDCDGPHEYHSYTHFLIGNEAKKEVCSNEVYGSNSDIQAPEPRNLDTHGATIRMPEYGQETGYQRDVYAEMMGY